MSRLIDADEAVKDARNRELYCKSDRNGEKLVPVNTVGDFIERYPTADPYYHAHWIPEYDIDTGIFTGYRCSRCGNKETDFKSKYCRICGARMDEKVKK